MVKNSPTSQSAPDQTAAKTTGRLGPDTKWTIVIAVAALVMYLPTLVYMVIRWVNDDQYSLAFLVPPVCGYFIWKLWPAAKATERKPSGWGLFTIVAGLLLHLVSVVLDIKLISDFSLLFFILGCCLYLRGSAFTKALWFPLAFLLFAVPIPAQVIDMLGRPMQLHASISTAHVLRIVGMQVTQDGVNLSVPGFDFKVAAACSGMSSLVALVGVTAVFAYMNRLPALYRWILFLLSIPIALAANTFRITTIALVGYRLGRDAAMSIYHDWSSPILFVVAIILLFVISGGFEWLHARRTTS